MSYLVLARKYRPQTFDQVVKQDHVTRTLMNAISSGRVAHAILFSGPRGTGKTTVARILAKAMNCEKGPAPLPCNQCRSCREITAGNAVDVFEIDGASNNGVDHIRELRENIKYMPAHSPFKIYIIDEVHMLSTAAFNALLKTLEEPPAHVMFIFATTEPQKIPITILSRCQRHDFRRINLDSITRHLEFLCDQEGADIATESLGLIAREAGGSMRDALSLLDQTICAEGSVTHAQVLDILGVIDRKLIFDFSRAVLQRNITDILDILDEIYHRGHDTKKFYSDLIEHFRNLLIVKIGQKIDKLVDVPAHEIELMAGQVNAISETFLTQILDLLFKEENTIKFSSQPKLALEMAFIRIFQIQPALSIDTLIEKLDALGKGVLGTDKGKGNNHVPVPYSQKETAQGMIRESTGQNSPAQTLSAPISPAKSLPATPFNNNENIDQTWERLLDLLSKKHPSLAACLTESTLNNLTAQGMEIEVKGNRFNCSMIKREKNMAILKKICGDFFGKSMAITINAQPAGENKKKQQADQAGRLKHEAINHPLVAEAVEIFNGKIVDVKLL